MDTTMTRIRDRQREVGGEIIILGHSGDWHDLITGEVNIEKIGYSVKQFGAPKMSRLEFELKSAEIDHTSPERECLCFLVMRGYTLEELECEFAEGKWEEYGRCTWLKEHAAYAEVVPEWAARARWVTPSIWHARFKTERAGEQHINFLSTQGIPFHKTMIFHKIVLRPPG